MITVTLSAAYNGRLRNPADGPIHPCKRSVPDLATATRHCMSFIALHDLGACHWTGGEVRDETTLLGRIAHNGKFIAA